MDSPPRAGNLSVATCISSAAVSSMTLLIATHLALALFGRAFPNRHRQYVSHESAIRPLARRFRLLFCASVLMMVDSLNHMLFFGSLWLIHEADPLVYRTIYVLTSSITSPLIVFAIVHRCIFIVGQNCPKRRRRLLVIAFLLCLGVAIIVGTSGGQIIASLLEVGPPGNNAELWSTSPFVSSKVSFVIIILPTLVIGSSMWSLAYLVQTSKTNADGAGAAQDVALPRISLVSSASNISTSSVREPSQNALADSGNLLNSTASHIHPQANVCTTVLPSLDGVESAQLSKRESRSAEILPKPLAAHLSKMVKKAASSSIHLKSQPQADAISTTSKLSFSPSQLSHAASSSHHVPPSQQLAYPLSRSFIVLTFLLSIFWISVLYIASRGPFVGPIRSATLMSLLGALGCWADASFEALARVAAKRQNNQNLETVSAHFSFFSTIRQTLGRAMGGSRRESESSRRGSIPTGEMGVSVVAAVGTRQASPTILRSAPTCPREPNLSIARSPTAAAATGEHHTMFLSLTKGGSPPGGSYVHSLVHSSRKGSALPSSTAESSRKGSVVMVTVPRKGK